MAIAIIINKDAPRILWIMICLRCGQCCIHLDIFIVSPSSILADGSIDPEDKQAMIFKPAGERCPHLAFKPEGSGTVAVCAIHHLQCYKGTPCDQFEQLGPEDAACVMSRYLRAAEMMQICVDYEKEIDHPDAEKHAERLQAILDNMIIKFFIQNH